MAAARTDDSSSSDRDPPVPSWEPTSRQASTQSLHSISDGPGQTSEYRSSLGRDRSSRESRRSVQSEIEFRFQQIHGRWQAEKRRAEIAERRVEDTERKLREMTGHLKAVNDARLEALRDAGRANEELKLYRVQLDNAQQEIYRAQDIIGVVDRQRHNAEKDAAKQRSKTRQLQETVLIQRARDEAYQLGLQEGLSRGGDLAFGAIHYHGREEEHAYQDGDHDDYSSQESRSPSPEHDYRDRAYSVRSRSIAPSEHSRAPTRQHASPLPVHPPLSLNTPNQMPAPPAGFATAPPSAHASENVRAPSMRDAPPSNHPSENGRPISVRHGYPPSLHPSENMRTTSVRNIPSVHPAESIRPMSIRNAPSVHTSENIQPLPMGMRNMSHTPRMSNAVIPPDNLIPSMDADNRIRIPPPFEFHRTPERPVSELPVVSDASQEPLPILPRSNAPTQRKHNGHSRNSSSGSNSSTLSQLDLVNNPFNAALRTPMSVIPEVNSAYSGSPRPEVGDQGDRSVRHQPSFGGNSVQHSQAPTSGIPADNQSQYRPHSRSSFAPSWAEPPPPASRRDSRISSSSTIPNIDIQPPSNTASLKTDSQWGGGSGRGESPHSQRAPLPGISETQESGYQSSIYNGMPGGYVNTHPSANPPSGPPVIPKYVDYDDDGYKDDDAISSALSVDTLTTPPAKHRAMESDWSSVIKDAERPVDLGGPVGSSSTSVWAVPQTRAANVTSGRSKKTNSKGSTY